VVAVEQSRTAGDKTTTERRYDISSLPGTDAERMARIIRTHWSVDNQLHWSLDVGVGEDASGIRTDHGPESFSILRKIALTLVKRERSSKRGIQAKRKRAGWDHRDLLAGLAAGLPDIATI
jgi:predicted transposase YbfD/YdcC